MKIVKGIAGTLTNFEVYDFLRRRGVSTDPAERIMSTKIRPSEFAVISVIPVFDYLFVTPACNQTRESITEFTEKAKEFKLPKAEVVNIVNIRPICAVELAPCIEEVDARMDEDSLEELQKMVDAVLPPHPYPPTSAEDDSAEADDEEEEEEDAPEDEEDATQS